MARRLSRAEVSSERLVGPPKVSDVRPSSPTPSLVGCPRGNLGSVLGDTGHDPTEHGRGTPVRSGTGPGLVLCRSSGDVHPRVLLLFGIGPLTSRTGDGPDS